MNKDRALDRALASLQLGRFEESLSACKELLSQDASHFDGLCIACYLSMQSHDLDQALDYANRALAVNDKVALVHYNRGAILQARGAAEEAIESYRQALILDSTLAEAHSNMSALDLDRGRPEQALASATLAIDTGRRLPQAYFNRGNAHRALKHAAEALLDYDQAIALQPAYPEALYNRGVLEAEQQSWTRATENLLAALALQPRNVNALMNLGNIEKELGRWTEALNYFERATSMEPANAEALANQATVLHMLGRLDEALSLLTRAFSIAPHWQGLLGRLLHEQLFVCDWNDFDTRRAQMAAALQAGHGAATPFEVLGIVDSPELQQQAARIFARGQPALDAAPGLPEIRPTTGVTTLGYFSADFRNHATAHLITELLELHDRSRFRVIGFSFGPDTDDPFKKRLVRACDEVIYVQGRTDREVAQLARDMRLDIAIDLKGYTTDARPGIFAQRPSAIQVSYLGYPGTMGVDFMDYVIADHAVLPADEERHYSEKVYRLPHCYQPNDRRRPINGRPWSRSELGLPEHAFVFCCFNNNWKISPDTFACWMRILRATAGSVLWLLEDNPWASANLRKAASASGVDGERLVFAPRIAPADHLARHRCADLFLDTWPCNAHTTASDALWAALPVLCCPGRSFAARVSASLLRAVNLPDLITSDAAEYVDRAIALARDKPRVKEWSAHLEQGRLTFALFDTPRYTRHLEAAYESMLDRARSGLPPDHFDVASRP